MQNDMVENITRELNNKITTEVQTVYLLVQIRKLMESKTKKPHFTLKMFCDWALHIELTRNKQIKEFLKEFDEAIGRAENGYGSINYEWFTLKKFQEAMKDFLTEFNLPKNILESSEWSLFLRLYNSVVSDCPVTKKDYPFKFIEEISMSDFQPDNAPAEYMQQREGFYLQWQVIKKDGNYINWEVLSQ